MDIDHTHPRAAFARLISSLDHLHKSLDRAAGQPGLLDAAAMADAGRRLARLADELSALTGLDHHAALVPDHAGAGQLFLASAELLGIARAADWWHDEVTSIPAELGTTAGAYL